jgi:hypothetical protein
MSVVGISDVPDLTDNVGSWGQSRLTTDIVETTRLTQVGSQALDFLCRTTSPRFIDDVEVVEVVADHQGGTRTRSAEAHG